MPESPDLVREIGVLETLRMTPIESFMRYGRPIRARGKPDPEAQKASALTQMAQSPKKTLYFRFYGQDAMMGNQ